MYVLIGILLLGILIAVHEFGHFLAARITGIEVMEFAIGMGPKIFGWTGKSGTKFSLRCIPLGGFCAFYGEDDVEGKTKDDPRAYSKQNVWKRIFTVAMGPVMNFVLAFVVAVGFFFFSGTAMVEPYIVEVEPGMPAAAAGLQPGDVITTVDGVNVLDGTMDALSRAIDGDQELRFTVRRGEEVFETAAAPVWDSNTNSYRIGISFSGRILPESRRLPLGEAIAAGWDTCVYASGVIVDALGQMFTDPEVLEQTSGPVGVVTQVSEQVKTGGLEAFLNLLVIISINLGIMNLLPIPGLDGSRIVFHVIEAVRGKPIKPEREALIHFIGLIFLLGVMAVFTLRDVARLFQ